MKKIIVLILIAAFLMISLSCMSIAANSPGPGLYRISVMAMTMVVDFKI